MNLFGVDLNVDPVFIAEIGVNHEGNLEAAKNLMTLAKEAGYHAAKFQIYNRHSFVSNFFEDKIKRIEKFSLSKAEYEQLRCFGREIKLPVFASAISHDMVDFLAADGVIKIASGDIDFQFLLNAVSKSSAKVILSTGASNHSEIMDAVKWIKDVSPVNIEEKLVLLACTSEYPCPIESANVRRVQSLRSFGCKTGFSNHVVEQEAVLCAAALGADVFEFHFTDSREGKEFHDHLLSFEPAESKDIIAKVKKIRSALGSGILERSKVEQSMYRNIRKGLIYKSDLECGRVIEQSDISFARPAVHFHANDLTKVVKRKLKKNVKAGDLVQRDDF